MKPGAAVAVRFTHQDELFMRAVELGCLPKWTGYGWVCMCSHGAHGHSERRSITPASLIYALQALGFTRREAQ